MPTKQSSFLIRLSLILCTLITPCGVFAELNHRPLEVTDVKQFTYRLVKLTQPPDYSCSFPYNRFIYLVVVYGLYIVYNVLGKFYCFFQINEPTTTVNSSLLGE